MHPSPWRARSFELATFKADQTAKAIADPTLKEGEKLKSLGLAAGY